MNSLKEEEENGQGKEKRTYGSVMIERLTGNEGGRIDHMLQLFLIRAAGFLLPCYIMAWAISVLQ